MKRPIWRRQIQCRGKS